MRVVPHPAADAEAKRFLRLTALEVFHSATCVGCGSPTVSIIPIPWSDHINATAQPRYVHGNSFSHRTADTSSIAQAFGVICSPAATATFDGRTAHVPAWEDVLGWDMRRGEQVSAWHSTGVTDAVSLICGAPLASEENGAGRTYAVAYADGSVRLWADVGGEGAELVTFNGHRKGATALAWDQAGARVFSGGVEGEIVVWDVIGEVGLFRLKGHRGPVTAIHWLAHPTSEASHPGWLVTTSKDGLIKLWDLELRHCVQTCVVGRGEVVSCAVREAEEAWWIVTGSGDGECKGWEIRKDELLKGLTEDENGQVSKTPSELPQEPG